MDKSESIAELAKALAKAQAEIQPAKMNSINPFLKNRYADLGEVIQAARGPLTKNGIAVTQHAFTGASSVGIETTIMHESGEWMTSSMELPLSQDERGRSLAQSAGSLITYLRRYTFAAIVGIYADEDMDGTSKPKAPAVEAPANNGHEAHTMTIEEAREMTTAKGMKFSALTTEQLKVVVEKATDTKMRQAAQLILDGGAK